MTWWHKFIHITTLKPAEMARSVSAAWSNRWTLARNPDRQAARIPTKRIHTDHPTSVGVLERSTSGGGMAVRPGRSNQVIICAFWFWFLITDSGLFRPH